MTAPAQLEWQSRQRIVGRAPGRDLSIDYLRAAATICVVAAHCVEPYLAYPPRFPPGAWLTSIPIQDSAHSAICDGIFSLLDASIVSLWFFLSGLFTYKSLCGKGIGAFLRERLVRIGLPLLAMTVLLMPAALSAAWGLRHPGQSPLRFWPIAARNRFPIGPGWFLWVLLLFDFAAAGLFAVAGRLVERIEPVLRRWSKMPVRLAIAISVAALVFYQPLYLRYEEMWQPFPGLPFDLQRARLPVYALWMLAGILAGMFGLDQGLLARDGVLARRWPWWVGAAVVAGGFRWVEAVALPASPSGFGLISHAALWVLANTCLCFGLLALCRGVAVRRALWADSLARYAYTIFVFHGVFGLWVIRGLLGVAIPGLAKSAIAFTLTLLLSWVTAVAWHRVRVVPVR